MKKPELIAALVETGMGRSALSRMKVASGSGQPLSAALMLTAHWKPGSPLRPYACLVSVVSRSEW